jgi:hypothetical protein
MKAFEIEIDGQKLDYRTPQVVDLSEVQSAFQDKFSLSNLRQQSRHVIGETEIDGTAAIFKFATTPGISYLTELEAQWNDQFNLKHSRDEVDLWVPKNLHSGWTDDGLFYLVTDRFEGDLLVKSPDETDVKILDAKLDKIIEFAETIQHTEIKSADPQIDHQIFFRDKVQGWYEAIPDLIKDQYQIYQLLDYVEGNFTKLGKSTRHGDFAPWHIFDLGNNKLGLIDGEHAMAEGVEYYDLCFLIQRIYSINATPDLAIHLFDKLKDKNYDIEKLKIVMAGRAVGGYLDESFKPDCSIVIL